MFEQALKHEQKVTGQINTLYDLCFTEKAFAEMTELPVVPHRTGGRGEDRARDRRPKFRLVKNDPAAHPRFDRELGDEDDCAGS